MASWGVGIFQIVNGNFLGGLWIILIGWFLNSAAESTRRETRFQEEFKDVAARDLMYPDPETTSPHTRLTDIIDEFFLRRGRRAMLVCDEYHQLIGIVSLSDLKKVGQARWPYLTVSEVMTRSPIHSVGPDEKASAALQLLAEHDLNQLPVVHQGRVLGMLSRSDMIRYLQTRKELGLDRRRRR